MFKSKKANFIVSTIFRSLIVIFAIVGVISVMCCDNYMSQKFWMYFTVQSNVTMAITAFVFIILGIVEYVKPEFKIPNFTYKIKFIFTVAISLTFIVFSLILSPVMIADGFSWYLTTLENICLHNIVPIFAILDFLLFDVNFKSKVSTFLYGIIMPLYYLCFTLISMIFKADFGDGSVAPYFFLDYQKNSWFNIGNGQLGVFYWLLIILVGLLVLSLAILSLQRFIVKKHEQHKQKATNENLVYETSNIKLNNSEILNDKMPASETTLVQNK